MHDVVQAAAQLFETMRPVHSLGPADLELLLHGARLAGIGMHIDYYNRDRHAEYLVHSGDLHGFSHREIVLLAALVRCCESGMPDLSAYKSIVQAEDTRRAAEMAVLLGLARAIRRRLPSPVLGIDASVKKGMLNLNLATRSGVDAELLALERQERRLESVFKLVLRVRTASSPGA